MKKTIFMIIIMLAFVGCEQAAVDPVVIVPEPPIAVVAGCCSTIAGSCASGVGVTKEVCAGELGGTWNAGTQCNTTTGACE